MTVAADGHAHAKFKYAKISNRREVEFRKGALREHACTSAAAEALSVGERDGIQQPGQGLHAAAAAQRGVNGPLKPGLPEAVFIFRLVFLPYLHRFQSVSVTWTTLIRAERRSGKVKSGRITKDDVAPLKPTAIPGCEEH